MNFMIMPFFLEYIFFTYIQRSPITKVHLKADDKSSIGLDS